MTTEEKNIENKKEADKLTLIYNETEKCLARIKDLCRESDWMAENARTIRWGNEIFWNGVNKAMKKAFPEVNPTVLPHVVYRVNRYYEYLK